MKKENRKIAKERKAQERKKQNQQKAMKKAALIIIPILVIVALIWIISISTKQNADHNDANDSTTEQASSVLNTDTSLTVENGDTVNIDYVGTVDGVEFSGGSTGGMGTSLTIGSGMYIDDFEQKLIGSHVGDTVEVVVTFPENYGVEELNGKEAVFTTVINGIYK